MAIVTRTFAAASCSWIDSATALPEVDKIPFNGPTVARASLTGNQGFRFCNFTEVWASFDTDSGNVNGQGFSNASGIYTSPSYAKVPSYTYPKFQNVIFEPEQCASHRLSAPGQSALKCLAQGQGFLLVLRWSLWFSHT